MEGRHPGGQVLVHLPVLVQPLAEHRVPDGLAARQDEAYVVLRDLHDEAGARFVEVILLHPAEEVSPSHAGEHDPVLDFTRADLPRSEEAVKSVVAHI